MPKIAEYGGQKVQTQVTNSPRASAAAGSKAFQANVNLAKSVSQVAQVGAEIVQRVDTTSAEEALVQFERDKNQVFFNPENGYFNTQGKNAYDSASATTKALEDLKAKYGDNLSPNARRMFDQSAAAHIAKSEVDIMRHSSKGLKAWEVSTLNAQVENTVENASLYWNQPEQLGVQNALGRQAILDAADMEGLGAEATAEKLQTYESSFAKTAISTATNTSSAEGQALFEKYVDRLEGPDKLAMEKAIKAKGEQETLQRNAQMAITTSTKLVGQYDSREDIRTEVNKIEDPTLRSKTMTEAMRQFNVKKTAESEQRAESFEAAEAHLYEGGSAETFQATDPAGWERLSTAQKKSLSTGKVVETNWVAYSDLMTLSKDELAQVDPTDYFDVLGKVERKALISAVKSAKGTGTEAQKTDYQIGRTRNAQVSAAIEQVLGKKAKWNDDKRAKADSFYDLLDSEVKYREKQKDAPLTSREFTDVLSELTREVTVKRTAFGQDWLAPDAEQSVTDIDPVDVRVLSDYLRKNGIPVTSENLLKAQRQAAE